MSIKIFSLVALLALFASAADLSCPTVLDGLTNGHFDLSTQFSTTSLSANWYGLSSDQVIGYEWAVVSANRLSRRFNETCRDSQGFSGIPDIHNWADVRKDTSATFTNLKLVPHSTYYVVLRTTLTNGVQVFSNSNGILILPSELNLEGNNKRHTEQHKQAVRDAPIIITEECPIDAANRCRKSQIAVRDILAQIYGPPAFLIDDPLFLLYQQGEPVAAGGGGGDDDDNSTEAGIVAGVIVGVLLLMICCLLLLGLLALLFAKGDDSGKFTENVVAKKQDHIDADHGTTTEHKLESDTRVEFPDLDPSTRLSVA